MFSHRLTSVYLSRLQTMHLLERCMQDVERRLTELERDPEPADDVTASTDDVTGPDRLLAVQRGLDDVNEQVARLTDNGLVRRGDG